ncbi:MULTISPECIES: GNAT family N-acetyltransferase [Aquimarina]|uniref:GNAT family N-acetyltransferase n=1 Tax=Aquimarina TaxID=290174 RepID=UPI000945926A|nr:MULTISPECIES: GNAT family protein [Aquimarina]
MLICKTQEIDIETVVSIEADTENSQFILPNSREEHLHLITDSDIEHLILKSENNITIGFVILAGLQNNNRSIEFRRIVINSKGRGYGRMAIKELKQYCFKKLDCHRLWLDVFETNERARYLYQSEGFKEEGILRDSIWVNGEFKNLIIMSMLENEYINTTTNKI